ncbi:MAG: GTP 3',8-cyclase MoaA [Flavobacteriales bacterium]
MSNKEDEIIYKKKVNLTDRHNRKHNYLRISLTDRCNFRCMYCMPDEKIKFTPQESQMNAEELLTITKEFVEAGVQKIRLTGGEPLIRKDIQTILKGLSQMPVELAMTSNGLLLNDYFDLLKEVNLKVLNVSLDTLKPEKFYQMTKRNEFDKVWHNILLAIEKGFKVKLNTVLIKDFNDDEILDLAELSLHHNLQVRFIEFMPFDGNCWDFTKMITEKEILASVYYKYPKNTVKKLSLKKHATAKNYKLSGSKGSFGIISSVTNPFCDTCNRLRLTSDGRMKNCLFSNDEADLLTLFRQGKSIKETVNLLVLKKYAIRAGMEKLSDFKTSNQHSLNRSMVRIGG